MEILKVLDYSNVFVASYFTDDVQCSHFNREHTLIYIQSGVLEINERGRIWCLGRGQCAFIRRDNRVVLSKRVGEGNPYCSVVLKFSRSFLREFYQTIDKGRVPGHVRREESSLTVLPADRADIRSLFESVFPYFESDATPSEELLKLKMMEGVYVLLHTDRNLYASLFDFVEPWKIDILDYLNDHYMYDLSMVELARFTGRSLATFKRDFKKCSDLPPQKWLIRKRLEVAHEKIRGEGKGVMDVMLEVGFKNLSHFSKLYKVRYGYPPSK